MKNLIELYESISKSINTVHYLLLSFALATWVVIRYEHALPLLVYIAIISIYVYLFWYLTQKKKFNNRLVVEYFCIILLLFDKDICNVDLFLFFLLPVVNNIFSITHTKQNNLFLYAVSIISFIILSCINGVMPSMSVCVAYITIMLVNQIKTASIEHQYFRMELFNTIDDYFIDGIPNKTYKVYKPAINCVNNFLGSQLISEILCYSIKGDVAYLVNSSKFVLANRIFLSSDQFISSEQFKDLKSKGFKIINHEMKSKNRYKMLFYTSTEEIAYIFIVNLSSKNGLVQSLSLLKVIPHLKLFFDRVTRIILPEKNNGYNILLDINHKMRYVNQATNTMHFIRNRLTPFKTLITVLEGMKMVTLKRSNLNVTSRVKELVRRCKIEEGEILNRASSLLSNTENPYNFQAVHDVSIKSIYSILAHVWYVYFESDINADLDNINEYSDYCVNVHNDGIELLLTDWISNMERHGNNDRAVSFTVSDESLSIEFTNGLNEVDTTILNMITYFSSDERDEITSRCTNGIYFIKTILTDMNIGYRIQIDEKVLKLNMMFKLIKKQ